MANMINPVTTPQFDAPFRLDANGVPVVVEQNSPEDVAACVYNIVVCPQGAKIGDPPFGVPMLLFQTAPIPTTALLAAIQRLEPRATYTISELLDALTDGIVEFGIDVNVQGSPTVTAS